MKTTDYVWFLCTYRYMSWIPSILDRLGFSQWFSFFGGTVHAHREPYSYCSPELIQLFSLNSSDNMLNLVFLSNFYFLAKPVRSNKTVGENCILDNCINTTSKTVFPATKCRNSARVMPFVMRLLLHLGHYILDYSNNLKRWVPLLILD